jgi:hypothetical protein
MQRCYIEATSRKIAMSLFSIGAKDYVNRGILQAVSRWLPSAAARVRARVRTYGICDGQSGRFSPSTSVSPANLHSTDYSTIIIYHLGLVKYGSSDRSTKPTQSHHMKKIVRPYL